MRSELIHKIFNVESIGIESLALEVFQYQYHNNPLYRLFCDQLGRYPELVNGMTDIPFLPISFFKTHEIRTGDFKPVTWFESSGTTGSVNSRHYIKGLELYEESFTRCFRQFYGDPADWCILGLLPAYLERQHSSLVYMVDRLIKLSGHSSSGFYLYDHDSLHSTLDQLERASQKTLLFGVSFALLDFAAEYPMELRHTTIMETGGMKGRRKELTRQELHEQIQSGFPGCPIHSEYGMTELLSQAYAGDDGLFFCPPWMKILLREEDDPLQLLPGGGEKIGGVINIIDLANIDSCSFIATDDRGRIHPNGGFEVLGRMDNSDIRGCSQLVL
ncbi:LuxE/PaaK family acyltransferase [Flavihumibacter sp.]|uniref:LuxE/PaaK family acyltransferase n=1 Tax=Flavihumibacter sp. TaxID=1913981 RepID=UPI002FCC1FD2